MQKNSKEFNYTLVTDSVGVSIEYTKKVQPKESFREEMEQQAEENKQFGVQYKQGLYDIAIGIHPEIDPGVVKDFRREEETVVKYRRHTSLSLYR